MEEIYLRENEEFIKLGQAMKKANLIESGAMAKEIILSGDVLVNGEIEYKRGRKLFKDDIFEFMGEKFIIK